MNVSIIYNSKHGTTKAYAIEIGKFLTSKGIENKVASVSDYDNEYLQKADIVLLGCWTSGLMLFAQHPDRVWKNFVMELADIKGKKLGLFTTYLLATGTMFRKMEALLNGKADTAQLILKSKNSSLTNKNISQLEVFIS
jgi:flavodoxin